VQCRPLPDVALEGGCPDAVRLQQTWACDGQHVEVLLAYIDESGDTGDPTSGGSLTYSLGCVLVDADLWPDAFDQLLDFRRRVKGTFQVPMRAEIKANFLIRSSGDLRPINLAPGARHVLYRAHMRVLRDLPARAFAVVVDKRNRLLPGDAYFDLAWEGMLQRLNRTSQVEKSTFAIFHDEGENDSVRKWARRARRHLTAGSAYGTGSLRGAARLLVDDPTPRRSHQSYFIQLADLVAYAGFRAYVPPSPNIARICPSSMWGEIGAATHTAVTSLRPRSAPGVVIR
jgi:hypothetical protein